MTQLTNFKTLVQYIPSQFLFSMYMSTAATIYKFLLSLTVIWVCGNKIALLSQFLYTPNRYIDNIPSLKQGGTLSH